MTDVSQVNKTPENLYKMQGLYRFVLALMVLWSHSVLRFFPETSGWFPDLQLGNVAVSSFFVLSGYLMMEAITLWYADRLPNFLINRYLRIGPPLFVAAVLSIAVHFSLLHTGELSAGLESIPQAGISRDNALLALLAPLFPFDSPIAKLFSIAPAPYYQFVRYSWAIMTELIFYWFLLFYALSLRYFGARLAGTSFLLIALLMFVLGTANQNNFFHNIAWLDFVARIPNVFHMQWAPHFLLGVMISRCAFYDWCSRRLKLILLVAAVLAILQLGLYAAHDDIQSALVVVVLYAIVVGSGFALMLSVRHHYSLRWLRLDRNWDSRFGNLSYPVYINQYAIALALLSVLSVYDIPLQNLHLIFRIGAFILFNLIIIFTAAVLIRLTDSMTDGLRDRFRGVSL